MKLQAITESKYDYSSTQVDMSDISIDNPIKELQKLVDNIDDDDLAADGKETDFHITVLYGIHTSNSSIISDIVKKFGPIKIKLGKISLFKSNENDVVKIEVTSKDLCKLNKLINDSTEVTNKYVYKPHLTLAYVKPGLGSKYITLHKLIGKEYKFDELTFSNKNGTKKKISLI
jgi:2'-5' RNA ligase